MVQVPPSVVLASASPVRRRLLRRLIDDFQVIPARIREEARGETAPERLTVRLAREKAAAVARRHPDALIVAADTVAYCDGEFMGKPLGRADAIRMLTKLTRGDHRVVTGLCLVCPDDRVVTDAVSTRIVMKPLSREKIEYLADLPGAMDAAGAYRLQREDPNVDHLEGSATNVMGLPVGRLSELLRSVYPNLMENT